MRQPSPARVGLFYSTVIVLLVASGLLTEHIRLANPFVAQLGIFGGLSLLFALRFERRSLREVFRLRLLSLTGAVRSLLLGVVSWGLIQFLGLLTLTLVERAGGRIPPLYPEMEKVPFAAALFIWGLLPAICEELAFRGYVQWGLSPMGSRAAVLLTGLLFGAMHLSLIRLIPLAVLGVIYATAAQRTGSILPGMIMHFINNGLVLILTYFGKALTGAHPNSEAQWALTAGMAAVLALLAFGLARSFGPGDLAADKEGSKEAAVLPADRTPPDSAPVARTLAAEIPGTGASSGAPSLVAPLLSLLPALLVYLLAAWSEMHYIFGPR